MNAMTATHEIYCVSCGPLESGSSFCRHCGGLVNSRPLYISEDLLELEFSEIGRYPRFLPGWYILPGLVFGVAVAVAGALLWSAIK